MAGNDWVNVQLTAPGAALAGDGVLRVVEGRHCFEISRGEQLRVTRAFDWMIVLANVRVDNEPLFELAGAPAVEEGN